MKRLVAFLIVLLILAGVVFYFGWIQIHLNADDYAVIFTKTGGWENEVVRPGEFAWRWQRLIPTNLKLHIFPIVPHSSSATLRGTLPGAESYAGLLEGDAPFSYVVAVNFTYRIRPESLPALARDSGLRSDALDDYYRTTDSEMQQYISESTLDILAQEETTPSASTVATIARTIESRLSGRYPDFEIISVNPARLELPDTGLYRETRARFLEVLDARTAALKAAAEEMAADQSATDVELARLERYGAILEEHPILLDYFGLAKSLDINDLDTMLLPPN